MCYSGVCLYYCAGIVRNVRMSSCNVLSWDLPLDGGKCIFEYRVRVYNGDTYANSSERKVQRTNIRRLTLNWLPVNGTASIVVSINYVKTMNTTTVRGHYLTSSRSMVVLYV